MRSCLLLALFGALVTGQDVLTALEGNTALSSFRSLLQGNSDLVDQINAANHTLLVPNNDVRHKSAKSYVKTSYVCLVGPLCCWGCRLKSTAISCIEVSALDSSRVHVRSFVCRGSFPAATIPQGHSIARTLADAQLREWELIEPVLQLSALL